MFKIFQCRPILVYSIVIVSGLFESDTFYFINSLGGYVAQWAFLVKCCVICTTWQTDSVTLCVYLVEACLGNLAKVHDQQMDVNWQPKHCEHDFAFETTSCDVELFSVARSLADFLRTWQRPAPAHDPLVASCQSCSFACDRRAPPPSDGHPIMLTSRALCDAPRGAICRQSTWQ